MPGMTRPNFPFHFFSCKNPLLHKLQKSVMRKRNAAAPGLNALPYLPYKKCAAILKFTVRLGHKIWKKREIYSGSSWLGLCVHCINLKTDDLSAVSDFRPIAITSIVGQIFFTVLSDRIRVAQTQWIHSHRNPKRFFNWNCWLFRTFLCANGSAARS